METALRILGAFILVDVLAAVLLVVLVSLVRNRQSPNERMHFGSLLGALIFLAIVSGLIYGGIWMCLRATS
jgi:Kef-type K+ transport system membrane component KefB